MLTPVHPSSQGGVEEKGPQGHSETFPLCRRNGETEARSVSPFLIRQDRQGLKDGQARLEQKIDLVAQNLDQDGEVLGEISAKLMEVVEDHAARIERLEDHIGFSHS